VCEAVFGTAARRRASAGVSLPGPFCRFPVFMPEAGSGLRVQLPLSRTSARRFAIHSDWIEPCCSKAILAPPFVLRMIGLISVRLGPAVISGGFGDMAKNDCCDACGGISAGLDHTHSLGGQVGAEKIVLFDGLAGLV